MEGSKPLPCAEQAVMFGGRIAGSGRCANVNILHLPTMVYTLGCLI